MAEVAGALERASKLYAGGHISDNEQRKQKVAFPMAPRAWPWARLAHYGRCLAGSNAARQPLGFLNFGQRPALALGILYGVS